MENKKKRFFFHFRKNTGELTLHWNKQCIPIKNVDCRVALETKWNSVQPRVVLRGFARSIEIDENKKALIT
jgi:hypothetical protein